MGGGLTNRHHEVDLHGTADRGISRQHNWVHVAHLDLVDGLNVASAVKHGRHFVIEELSQLPEGSVLSPARALCSPRPQLYEGRSRDRGSSLPGRCPC